MKKKLTVKEILEYEVRSNKLISRVSNKYLQSIFGWWIGRRVKRKYGNYVISLSEAEMVEGTKKEIVGVKCPVCGGELVYVDYNAVLLSSPPQRQVKCTKCSHIGYVFT